MKNYPYIRYILLGILFLVFWILGWILYPFIYPFKDSIRKHKTFILWWFLNNDEPTTIENDYGAEWWRQKKGLNLETANWFQKFIISYRWVAIRNPHYVLKLLLRPKQGDKENKKVHIRKGMATALTFRNYDIHGQQYVTYSIKGYKYFRYSHSILLFWGSRWFFGYRVRQYIQAGNSDIRYIYKIKHRLEKK